MNGDLRPILAHYGVPHPEGSGWRKMKCPVHQEVHPSCSVNLDYGWLECHACGFSGGAVKFVAAKEGVEIEAAARICAQITGGSDSDFRGGSTRKPGRGVPRGQGYRPRLRVSPRLRGGGDSGV